VSKRDRKPARFVAITSSNGQLIALDSDGVVWIFNQDVDAWAKLPAARRSVIPPREGQ
jgi:hypothetical protein